MSRAGRKDREEMKPQLYRALGGEVEARDRAYVAERLRHVFAQLTAEGVFEGMTEAQARAVLFEAVADLGISPDRGSN